MRVSRLAVLLSLPLSIWCAPPTLEQLIRLRGIGGAAISPDGRYVAYTESEADMEQNAFVTQIHMVEVASARRWQLTRGMKSSEQPKWSADSRWIAFLSDREGGKNQIFIIAPNGGEARQVTKSETAISQFEWAPDGEAFAYLAPPKAPEDRQKALGNFDVVRRDYAHAHIWQVPLGDTPQAGAPLTEGKDFSVSSLEWAADGKRIVFAATKNPDLVQQSTSDIFVLDVASKSALRIVDQAGSDRSPTWSPDGKSVAFVSTMANPLDYIANARIAVVSAEGGPLRSVTGAFDEQPSLVAWKKDGIYFTGLQKMQAHVFRVDPATTKISLVSATSISGGISLSEDGQRAAFTASDAGTLSEVYVSGLANWGPKKLTDSTAQTNGWTLPTDEVISWKSKDGTIIEGVLSKPRDFDPSKKHPLLCVIHGGPTGIDRPQLAHPRYYPIDVWTARGALVLRVNYRGSAGYGEAFRKLNRRNLGVGDAWDVESGVEHLIARGWADPAKVGVMGWSQGGYISAFLTTHSKLFRAVSVGAGISNWATYYYNTDITTFTLRYLGDDPADDPAIYAKTSPMTKILEATTPTLIQHGELDKRVPIANGYELRQGLEDRGVPVEMIVYKGFGHGITKPKEALAVLLHNQLWFGHYIFGDAAPDFVRALPK
jgi:dipeptidyl aminopeptidase/acylaminoacyl peptidase